MIKTFLTTAALLAATQFAQAASVVDTGAPNGSAVGAIAFDSVDWTAAKVSFAQAADIGAIQGHILGGATGETFDISLLANDGAQGPGTLLYTTTATFGSDGWNGASGLAGWTVAAGSYWVEFEIQGADTLGSGSITGALLDLGAPNPVALTASTSNSGFSYGDDALSIGLRVDTVSSVPEPAIALQMLAGAMLLLTSAGLVRRRR
ncbi:hypothetical protein [Scleromatobacter humisilvae]|uniref:PEP-CTERM protein-sorting domain-containing protein n=1 Tax=Scleromatobacter humisilvae TaxID=2897159 RepID=A0A9X1YP35_9BURK|nr:hypothetical protein [Scleromatobacter humisilvae]MCK9687982.1 hypothetical protein [Scleromatobacter humisilvae]